VIRHFQNQSVVLSGGVQTAVYFMLSVIIVLFFALGSSDETTEFRSTMIFMVVFLASYLMLLGLSVNPAIKPYFQGKNATLFFQHDITKGHLLWIPLGFVMAFGFSLLVSNIGLDDKTGAIVSIAGSGTIMMFIFFRTGAILIPIAIHALFNSTVILLSSNIVDFSVALSPIPIPEVAVQLGSLSTLASEMIFQAFLVAPSEEMFKMLVIAFVLAITKSKFDTKGAWVYIAGGFSIAIWTAYHLIIAV
jgi:hypothetical protein